MPKSPGVEVGRDQAAAQPLSHKTRQRLLWTMLISSVLGLVASFVLSYDAIILAGDADATFGCDINPVLSCGTVARSWQASIFGFPNAFIGMITEPIIITVAVAALSGSRFHRVFMMLAQLGYAVGVALAYWLFYQSVFVIGAMCPWCLLITFSVTGVFFALLKLNVLDGNIPLPGHLRAPVLSFYRSSADIYLVIAWMLVLVTILILKYGAALLTF